MSNITMPAKVKYQNINTTNNVPTPLKNHATSMIKGILSNSFPATTCFRLQRDSAKLIVSIVNARWLVHSGVINANAINLSD